MEIDSADWTVVFFETIDYCSYTVIPTSIREVEVRERWRLVLVLVLVMKASNVYCSQQ